MSSKATRILPPLTLAGVILGAIVGTYVPEVALALSFLGQLFVNALRLVIIPLILIAVVLGVATLNEVPRVGRALGTTILYFLVTTVAAVAIGLVAVNLFGPGLSTNTGGAFVPSAVDRFRDLGAGDIVGFLIPPNIFGSALGGSHLGLILFALAFGAVLITVGSRQRIVIDFLRGAHAAMLKLIGLLLWAAPVGLFCLVGETFAENPEAGSLFTGSLGSFVLVVIGALLFHGLIVLPLVAWLWGKRSPQTLLGPLGPALATAFGTGSSATALPVTYSNTHERAGVDNRPCSLVLPLGTTMNLDGTAMYVVIGTLFVAQAFGVALSIGQIITIALLAVAFSIGAAGIPGAGLMTMVAVFGAAGFPDQAYAGLGLILVADWLIDRCRAVINVWGDAVGAAVVGVTVERTSRRHAQPSERERLADSRRQARPSDARRRDDRRRDDRRRDDRHRDDRRRRDSRRPDRDTRRDERDARRGDRSRRRPEREPRRTDRDARHPDSRKPRPGSDRPETRRAKPESRPPKRQEEPSPFAMKASSGAAFDIESPETSTPDTSARERSDPRTASPHTSPTSGARPSRPPRAESAPAQGDLPSPLPPRDKPVGETRDDQSHRLRRKPAEDTPTEREPQPPFTHPTGPFAEDDRSGAAAADRERARLAEQLAELRKRESEQQTRREADADDQIRKEPPPVGTETPTESFPRIDYLSNDTGSDESGPSNGDGPRPRNDQRDSAPTVPPAKDTTESEPAEKPEYGRQRHVARPGAQTDESDQHAPAHQENSEDTSEEFNLEEQTFGRTKKKRVRR